MNMNYNVSLSRVSAKYLKRTDQASRKRIVMALEGLKHNPPVGDIISMKGMAGHENLLIFVKAIGPRGDIY